MPTIVKTTTMQEIIEDVLGEVDIDELIINANIAYTVGYRKAEASQFVIDKPLEPYGSWVWISRYWEDEQCRHTHMPVLNVGSRWSATSTPLSTATTCRRVLPAV